MRALRHVTLTTGHVRDSTPGEVSPEALAACHALLDRCLAAPERTYPIPGAEGYSLSAKATTKCLTAVVWADGPPSESIVTIGVATHSRCGASLWRALHQFGSLPVVTDPERAPHEPWCAAAIEAGIIQHMDSSQWIGDLERCLGWAFIEMSA